MATEFLTFEEELTQWQLVRQAISRLEVESEKKDERIAELEKELEACKRASPETSDDYGEVKGGTNGISESLNRLSLAMATVE